MMERSKAARGIALLMVIWVLAALEIILGEFVYVGRTSLNAARNQKAEAAAYYLARGAVEEALVEIGRNYLYLLPAADGGVVFVREGDSELADVTASRRMVSVPGVGKYSYLITDEESKINVNRLDRKQLVEFFRAVGFSLGVERDTLIDSILDWRDADDLHRLNGAEDDYYQSLTPPYRAKNADFSTPQELLLVRGMTRDLFDGRGEGSGHQPLGDMVTVWADRPNYNTAPPEALIAWLGAPEAEKIVAQRQVAPFKDNRGQSNTFTILAEGTADGSPAGRRIRLVASRRAQAGKAARTTILQWIDLAPKAPEKSSDEG